MKFEYRSTLIGAEGTKDLMIPVSEILKAKNHSKNQNATKAFNELQFCLRTYTHYYDKEMTLLGKHFDALCRRIGSSGNLVISFAGEDIDPSFIARVISNKGEYMIDLPLMSSTHRNH